MSAFPGESREVNGLAVVLDRLVYSEPHTETAITYGVEIPQMHAFIYFLTIHNQSKTKVTLKGRKWVLRLEDGTTQVIEGGGIVGQSPTLRPGEHFSYNSYHLLRCNASASGSFHGVDSQGQSVHVAIPPFEMRAPDGDGAQGA
ncbi:MAG: ApaG domain [Opitutales bacterium]